MNGVLGENGVLFCMLLGLHAERRSFHPKLRAASVEIFHGHITLRQEDFCVTFELHDFRAVQACAPIFRLAIYSLRPKVKGAISVRIRKSDQISGAI